MNPILDGGLVHHQGGPPCGQSPQVLGLCRRFPLPRQEVTAQEVRSHFGGAIQVMLSEDSCYSGLGAELEKMGGLSEHYGAARSMSPMWIHVVQEKRPHSYG